MFNFLDNWTIARKLGAVAVVLALGLGILGAAFNQVLMLEAAEAKEHRDREHFSELVGAGQVQALSAARHRVEYLRSRDEERLIREAEATKKASATIGTAEGEAKSEEERHLLGEFQKGLTAIRTDFQQVVTVLHELGDETTGLLGDLDAAAQVLAKASAAQSVMAVHNGLTVVRVAARDFIAGPSDERLALWTAAMDALDASIAGVGDGTSARHDMQMTGAGDDATAQSKKAKKGAVDGAAPPSKMAMTGAGASQQQGIAMADTGDGALRDAAQRYRSAFAPVVARKLELATLVAGIAATEERLDELVEQLAEATHHAEELAEQAKDPIHESMTLVFFGIMIVVAILVGLALYLFVRDLISSTRELTRVMQAFQSGNDDERVSLKTRDELGQLGSTFNYMLDARVQALHEAQRESEILNANVISLLQTVFQLSQKDLTARAQVTEDVTGPMADALNQLAGDTAAVLSGVVRTAGDVSRAAQSTRAQSASMSSLAASERDVTEQAVAQLLLASTEMEDISKSAQDANVRADAAIVSTRDAMRSVVSTVTGINDTRDTIREAEKRVKRLGERAQEISEAVGLINTIAERTHILALNASMHATSAGEAGRGFAVVADEVQHLAENAREATQQIATLVGNIQHETNDTVNSINDTISQVVAGSQIAEQAGAQMRQAEIATQALVEAVNSIARRSAAQAAVNTRLRAQVGEVQASTMETARRVLEQSEQSEHLVQYAASLVASVSVFTLPDSTPTQH